MFVFNRNMFRFQLSLLRCIFICLVPFQFLKFLLTKCSSDFFPCCYSNNQLSYGILIKIFLTKVVIYEQTIYYDSLNVLIWFHLIILTKY